MTLPDCLRELHSLSVDGAERVTFMHEDNRDDKQFECVDCEYEANADYNAAKNIANRYCGYIHRAQTSRGGWVTSQLPLMSGMLNVNGNHTPAELLG